MTYTNLVNMKQGGAEPIRSYVDRFQHVLEQLRVMDDNIVICAFLKGV